MVVISSDQFDWRDFEVRGRPQNLLELIRLHCTPCTGCTGGKIMESLIQIINIPHQRFHNKYSTLLYSLTVW